MNFFERYSDYISIWCFVQQFQFSKMPVTNNNWLQSKSDGKHKLSVKFSYVIIIYQVWNNHNTLNVLFTSCAINILLFFDEIIPPNLEAWEPFVHVFWENICLIMFRHMCMPIFKYIFNVLKKI
jgi:hypothetical protein